MKFPALEIMLKEFDASDVKSLTEKRTHGRQVRAIGSIEPPALVDMSADECKKLCELAGLKYESGYFKRVISRTTTTEMPDRYGDIVRADGIDVSNYIKNPIVLFAHEHSMPPVGNSINLWHDKGKKCWKSYDLYLDERVDPSGRSDLVFRMVASGAMPGGSIGFLPRDYRSDHTKKERDAIGIGPYGVEYLSCEYLEHSACSVPANPECLLNTLKAIELGKFFGKADLDNMEKLQLINADLIDVFSTALGTAKTTLTPADTDNFPAGTEETTDEYTMKPYPNEHACRLVDPAEFTKMRRGTREHEGKEYSIIYGQLKGKVEWLEQAYRYSVDIWTVDQAKDHCKSHNGILFEPAADGKHVGDECTECDITNSTIKKQSDEADGKKVKYEIVVNIPGIDKVIDLLGRLLEREVSKLPPDNESGERDEENKGLALHKLIDMKPSIFQ